MAMEGSGAVVKGGSYREMTDGCLSASRRNTPRSRSLSDIGFRLVLVSDAVADENSDDSDITEIAKNPRSTMDVQADVELVSGGSGIRPFRNGERPYVNRDYVLSDIPSEGQVHAFRQNQWRFENADSD